MQKLIQRRSKKTGLPPGSVVYIGEGSQEKVTITVFHYAEQEFKEQKLNTIEECFVYKDLPSITWVNIDGLHDLAIIQEIAECFGIHPLVLEDIVNTEGRPKLEEYEDYFFIVLKMLYHEKGDVYSEHVCLIVGKNFVLSFQENPGDLFDPIRDRIRHDKGRVRKSGADYLAYTLLDTIIDYYFVIMENLSDQIDKLEEEVLTDQPKNVAQNIHILKRNTLFLRKNIWPLREVIGGLERTESTLIKKSTHVYLRDVYDHTIQVIDTLETYRDMLSGLLDVYLTHINNRMNEVMKTLTIITTIFIPLNFIVGIYGMNFKFLPELGWKYGYFAVLGLMLTIALGLAVYFKKKKWF